MNKKEEPGKDPFGRVFVLKGEDDLRQRDVAAWNRAYIEMKPVGTAEDRQAQLQAAIVAGWIVSPEATVEKATSLSGRERVTYLFDGQAVEEMRPAEVFFYGRLCGNLYNRVTAVPDPKP